MTASVENDANHSVRVREVARTGLEVFAHAFGITVARRDHPRSWSFDDALQGELQNLKESTDRLRNMYGLKLDTLVHPTPTARDLIKSWSFGDAVQGELLNLKESTDRLRKIYGLKLDMFFEALAAENVVRLTREGDVDVEFAPSNCVRQDVRDFDEELAERLLSESMDRLAVVARDVSDLAAGTAIDLAMIETKRAQIDRAQAENWALLRELTEQAQ